MSESLVEISKRICANANGTAKPLAYYVTYEPYLRDLSGPLKLLEIGVHTGESLKVWASYFPQGTIIGIDIVDHRVDFSKYPNIVFEQADQTDGKRLKEICRKHAPDGLDIVIDDASHLAQSTAASYVALFPLVRPGGLYVIEDWGTGYFDDWPDGRHLERFRTRGAEGENANRFPSHDYGLVGFIKSLVDEIAGDKRTLQAVETRPGVASFVHVNRHFVVLKKA